MRPLRVPIPVSTRPMRRKTRPIQSANPTHPAVLAEGQRNPPQRRPQIAGPQGSKPHSTPIGAASAANASGLVQTPQSKVPRPKLPAVHEANAPGHFRLSHSVREDLSSDRALPSLKAKPACPNTPCIDKSSVPKQEPYGPLRTDGEVYRAL